MYDYEWVGYGLVITDPEGSCFMQGDEAAQAYDEFAAVDDPKILQAVLSEYSMVMQ